MKKTITLCLVGGALLIGNAAKAFNPGVYYYSNEQTKAEAYSNRMGYIAKAGKAHYKQVKKHVRQTNRAYEQALRQEQQYRRMLASEQQYMDISREFHKYPQYDYHTENVHATVARGPRLVEVMD
jgi:hypothetical protein